MKKFGLIIADEYEYIPFLEFAKNQNCTESKRRNRDSVSFIYNEKEIVAVKSGVGKVNSAAAAAFLISDDKVDAIISFGLSGAISGFSKYDIVAGKSYIECDFDLTALGYPLGKKPQDVYVYNADKKMLSAAMTIEGMKEAVCGCGDIFLNDPEKKKLYKEVFNITEFDMETGAEASVCFDSNIPFIAIRQISDTADDAADSYTEMNSKCDKTLTKVIAEFLNKI